jgi:homoserine dehydrogenase
MARRTSPDTTIRVALLGCGNVGLALYELLAEPKNKKALFNRTGLTFEVVGIAVSSLKRKRSDAEWFDPSLLTTNAAALVVRPDVDVVVEVMGGVDETLPLFEAALKSGSSVVSANKALLALHGRSLARLAHNHRADLRYEAAVAGAVPILRVLRDALSGEQVTRVMGIVNGTTNFILSLMDHDGAAYGDALAEAQRLGYAEKDPTADVEGYDAASKAAILASLAFDCKVSAAEVSREGITKVSAEDVAFARQLGYAVKLLAIAEVLDGSELSVRVQPTMVPADHPLAAVDGAFNAVFVEGEACGELMLYGRGAGGKPTASAVLGDLVEVARSMRRGGAPEVPLSPRTMVKRPLAKISSAFYVTLDVADQPGVLAKVTEVFGRNGVSIRSMEQVGLGDEARLVFVTHQALEGSMTATIQQLRRLKVVDRVGTLLRVIENGGEHS